MTKRASIPAPHFNLRLTLESGQVFHWLAEADGGYRGLIGKRPVRVKQAGDELQVTPGAEVAVARYFALDHDLEAICASFPTDPTMSQALAFCHGLRLIRQPLWECLATFLTSAMKQVPHIRQMSYAIRQRFGQQVPGWEGLATYPEPERLARAVRQAPEPEQPVRPAAQVQVQAQAMAEPAALARVVRLELLADRAGRAASAAITRLVRPVTVAPVVPVALATWALPRRRVRLPPRVPLVAPVVPVAPVVRPPLVKPVTVELVAQPLIG
ncbi:MAG: DNA glycosylase [Verrucomicrobiota bacterium]